MSGTLPHQLLPRQTDTVIDTPNTGSATGDQLLKLVANPFQAAVSVLLTTLNAEN